MPPDPEGFVQAARVVPHFLEHHRYFDRALQVIKRIRIEAVLTTSDLTAEVAVVVVLGDRSVQDVAERLKLLVLEAGLVRLLQLLIFDVHRPHGLVLLGELVKELLARALLLQLGLVLLDCLPRRVVVKHGELAVMQRLMRWLLKELEVPPIRLNWRQEIGRCHALRSFAEGAHLDRLGEGVQRHLGRQMLRSRHHVVDEGVLQVASFVGLPAIAMQLARRLLVLRLGLPENLRDPLPVRRLLGLNEEAPFMRPQSRVNCVLFDVVEVRDSRSILLHKEPLRLLEPFFFFALLWGQRRFSLLFERLQVLLPQPLVACVQLLFHVLHAVGAAILDRVGIVPFGLDVPIRTKPLADNIILLSVLLLQSRAQVGVERLLLYRLGGHLGAKLFHHCG